MVCSFITSIERKKRFSPLVKAVGVRCITAFLVSLLLLSIASAELRHTGLREVAVTPSSAETSANANYDSDMQVLDSSQSIKRKIGGGQTHYYRIMLMTDQFLRLDVDQRGIDVSVMLYEPGGKKVVESNRFIGEYGPETISWVTESPGVYKLEVRSIEKEQIAEYYEVKLLEERVATFQDRSRIAPQRVFLQAEEAVPSL